MQAASIPSLKPPLFQAERVRLSAVLQPESVAARFEQPPVIQPMTSVSFVTSLPHSYRALRTRPPWNSRLSTPPTTATTQRACRESYLPSSHRQDYGSNVITSVAVVNSLAGVMLLGLACMGLCAAR
ncbi:hypothetical protein MTO96_018317 [Rhipicephalus appendiculatus]